MDISINYKDADSTTGRVLYATLRKEIETEMIPVPQMEIEDSAWREPMKIEKITANFQEGYYHLWLGSHTYDKEICEREAKMYEGHKWYRIFNQKP